MPKSVLHGLAIHLALLLTACGGSDPRPTGPVTATITPKGGTVRAISDDGATFTLTFPAGAVVEPLKITLTPRAPEQGSWARFELSPAGTQLKAPVEITLTAPANRTVVTSSTFYFGSGEERTLVPTTVDPASRTLTTRTLLLGYAPVSGAGNIRAQANDSDFLNVADIECQIALDSLQQRFEMARLYSFSSPQSAHQLALEIEATKKICADDPEALNAWLASARPVACNKYRDATANAALIESDTYEKLLELVREVLFWESMKQVLGTDCDGLGGNFVEVINTEFQEFIENFIERVNSSDFPREYNDIWHELRQAVKLLGEAALLGLEEAQDKIEDELLPPMFNKLREAAYAECRSRGEQAYLADILLDGHLLRHPLPTSLAGSAGVTTQLLEDVPAWAGFSGEDVARDIQYCASRRMTLEVFTALPEKIDALTRTLKGGDAPGTHEQISAETRSPVEGSWMLSGDIKTFLCAPVTRLSKDELVIKLNGVELERAPHTNGAFLRSPIDLEIESALQKAGINPEQKASYPLEIYREGEACDGLYGDSRFKLFTIDIELDPKPKLINVRVTPDRINAGQTTTQTFFLQYKDEGANLKSVQNEVRLLPSGDGGVQLAVIGQHDDVISGFGQADGTGSWTANVFVSCDYQGNGTKRNTFRLFDAFSQGSEAVSVDTTIDYSNCP